MVDLPYELHQCSPSNYMEYVYVCVFKKCLMDKNITNSTEALFTSFRSHLPDRILSVSPKSTFAFVNALYYFYLLFYIFLSSLKIFHLQF